MANRRMFSLDVVDTDIFLDLPTSSQALYFHLGMRADDDGFVSSPKRITTMIGANQDDLKLLIAKGFVIVFEEGIIVISHWKRNNYLKTDRHKNTIYQNQLATLTVNNGIYELDTSCIQDVSKTYPSCIQNVSEMGPQDRLGKDRIGKSSLSKDRLSKDKERVDYQQIADMYNDTCVSFPCLTRLSDSRKNAIKAGLRRYSIEDFRKLFTMAEESSFLKGQNNRNWSANFDWLIQDSNMTKVLDGNYVDRKEKIKAEIYKIAHTHISEKAFERYRDKIHDLICLCCPLEGFTQEQVDYMLHEWGAKPLSEKYVLTAPEEDSFSHWDQELKKSLPSSLGGADERQDAK